MSSKAWNDYMELVGKRPGEFRQNPALEIIFDEDIIREFEERSGRTIGVIYASRFNILVVDLVKNVPGRRWNPNEKKWTIPADKLGFLLAQFKGTQYESFVKIISDEHVNVASLMIFLNKTCFNGLYRVNKDNDFNVPFAGPKNPLICDKENILEVSNKLKKVELFIGDYSKSIVGMNKNSLVYFDPPYRPINGKKSFDGYSKSDFNDNHQKDLSNFCKKIDKKGVKFILSNSDPWNYDKNDNFFDDLYNGFNVERIFAKRFINSNGNKRGPITEILVSNY